MTNLNESREKAACFVDKIVKKCKKHEESGDKWGIVVYTHRKSGGLYEKPDFGDEQEESAC